MTSSSDAAAASGAGIRREVATAGVRASAVRAPSPVRVIDRIPPPPPPPPVDVTGLAAALQGGLEAVRAQVDRAFAEIERECVELALAAAERIVRRKAARGELELDGPLQELFAARRGELAALPARLRLHPEDAKVIAPRAAELVPAGTRVEIVDDPAQPRGHLVLEIGAARLVRTLDEELRRLRQRLLAGAAG